MQTKDEIADRLSYMVQDIYDILHENAAMKEQIEYLTGYKLKYDELLNDTLKHSTQLSKNTLDLTLKYIAENSKLKTAESIIGACIACFNRMDQNNNDLVDHTRKRLIEWLSKR